MTVLLIVYKSLRQHLVSTLVSAFAIALAGGLLMAVWVVKQESNLAFTGVTGGFDAVLGARSSKLQLVLNSIFHLEDSPGNIAAADVETIQKNPNVEVALPIAVGDNYKGYRLVGTTLDLFEKVEFAPGHRYQLVSPGRPFGIEAHEAVVGSFAAERLGLKAEAAEAYAKTMVAADLEAPGDADIIRKARGDLAGMGMIVGEAELRSELARAAAAAGAQFSDGPEAA